LSDHKWPDSIYLSSFLPKTSTGKIALQTLRKMITGELAQEIFDLMNTKRFRRAHPYDADEIIQNIQRHIIQGTNLSFVAYWGCGKRDSICQVDRDALDRLLDYAKTATKIPELQPSVTLILADVHCLNNGIPQARFMKYFMEIQAYVKDSEVKFVSLDSLWKKLNYSTTSLATEVMTPSFNEKWEALSIKNSLIETASKHYETDSNFEVSAKRYFQACLWDSKVIEHFFPSSIFLTYNGPEMRELFPKIPTMFLFSSKHGNTAKPWFTESDSENFEISRRKGEK
jgi:L-tyrosine isonitrile synthase